MIMRGSSGASLDFYANFVVKRHDTSRIHMQGTWLYDNPSPVLPEVTHVDATSYTMERLVTVHPRYLNHLSVWRNVIEALQTHIWSKPPVIKFDIDALRAKIIPLADQYCANRTNDILTVISDINWDEVPLCLTHGDPTFENIMFRPDTDEIVLIDPIPATPQIPDMRAVDLGKLIQSMTGWESIRYNDSSQRLQLFPIELMSLMPELSSDEFTAAVFWAIVHVLRAFPYVDESIHTSMRGMIRYAFSII